MYAALLDIPMNLADGLPNLALLSHYPWLRI